MELVFKEGKLSSVLKTKDKLERVEPVVIIIWIIGSMSSPVRVEWR